MLFKIGDTWFEKLNIEKSGIWEFGVPEMQFWEGVTFRYNLFTKSVISGSKCPKSIVRACSCLLMLARARLVLAGAQPVPVCSVPQSPVLGGCHFPS